MIKQIFFMALVALSVASGGVGADEAGYTVRVQYVIDGDTFLTQSGEKVRLIGINTPEKARAGRTAEPFAVEAQQALAALIDKKDVRLVRGERPQDRYKRTLAHVYLQDGTWVNKTLVEKGVAHVYTFPDNREGLKPLFVVEEQARQAQKGIWALPRWRVLGAEEALQDTWVGRFYLVKGQVQHVARANSRTYLNFGTDWRTDFTVEIPDKYLPLFTQAGIDPRSAYQGHNILIRGIIKPVNGIMVTATHPEQLTILP